MSLFKYVKLVLMDKERKSLLRIIKESTYCGIKEKEIPHYYFTNLLYKKIQVIIKGLLGERKHWSYVINT